MIAACGIDARALQRLHGQPDRRRRRPGQSRSSLLANSALTRTVPDAASTALSTNCSLPSMPPRALRQQRRHLAAAGAQRRQCLAEIALRQAESDRDRIELGDRDERRAGRLHGAAGENVDRAGTSRPRRDDAVVRQADLCRLDRRPIGSDDGAGESTSVWLVSTAPCEMKFCSNRSWLRASWRSASASAAWSLASWARAFVRFTSSLRASSVNNGWPARTNWPSLICTLVMMLATCGLTSTLLSAVTVPVASSITSMSRFWTTTVVTLTGGPAAATMRRLRGRAAPSSRRIGRSARA